jgi:hypothetical protein
LHTNKQGLNPFDNFRVGAGATDPTSLGGYFKAVTDTNKDELKPTTETKTSISTFTSFTDLEASSNSFTTSTTITTNERNRLLGLYNDLLISKEIQSDILSYPGGPGSILGIGKTNIKFATGNGTLGNDVRTGKNNIELKNSGFFTSQGGYDYSVFTTPLHEFINKEKQIPLGVSLDMIASFPLSNPPYNEDSDYFKQRISIISKDTKADEFTSKAFKANIDEPETTYLYGQILNIPNVRDETAKPSGQSVYIGKTGLTTPGDFRALLRNPRSPNKILYAPNYTTQNIEAKLGDPGNRNGKDLQNYHLGATGFGAASINSYDKLNQSVIYKSESDKSNVKDDVNKDLVKFRIGVIDNDAPDKKIYIHFRAFLDSITDSFSADWKNERYVGRGENFYTYGGFDRKVSLGWTVAAQSKTELIPMYKKLNFLASVCAPNYSNNGYMRGNIVTLTVGGYFYEQPGIITGFSFDMNEDKDTWEIGIDSVGDYDKTVKELPHLIKVKSFQFIPIHTFAPSLQNNSYDEDTGDVLLYGAERYIALENKMDNNYGDVNPRTISKLKPTTNPPPPPPPPLPPVVLPPLNGQTFDVNGPGGSAQQRTNEISTYNPGSTGTTQGNNSAINEFKNEQRKRTQAQIDMENKWKKEPKWYDKFNPFNYF